MSQDFQAVGEAFARHYYTVFDSSRAGLSALYVSRSMFTVSDTQFYAVTVC